MSACYEPTLKKSSKGSYNHTQDLKRNILLRNDNIYPYVDCGGVNPTENQKVYAKAIFIKKNIKH